jgi:membrane protease YdiL (CAAX protease family)
MTPELPPLNVPPPEAVPAETTPPLEPPPPPRWSLTDLGLFVGFGALAFFLAYILVTAGYLSILAVGHRPTSTGETEETTFLSITFEMVAYVLLFGAIYALVAIRGRLPFWRALKWNRPTFLKALAFLAGGIILAAAVQAAPTIFPDRKNFPLQEIFTSPAVAYAVGGFAVLVAPLMEELIFRGVLFAIFEDMVGLRFAIATTAILFTALHIPEYRGAWNHLFLLLIVGLVFSTARGLTGSLAPSVLLHTAYNLCQLVMLFFATDHFHTFQGVLLR